MIKVVIDGREIETEPQRTILEVARENGISIPTLCYHPRLLPIGSCRLCVVEVEGMPKPLTACTTYVQDGMVVRTQSERLLELRREALKLILVNHPLDCPICDMAGECQLQNLVFELGVDRQDYSLEAERERGPKGFGLPLIRHWPDRCVLCLRCVRADHEVVGARALDLEGTGYGARVVIREDRCLKCGECVRACPVGAMTERTSPVRARPWQRSSHRTTCGHCSVGCQLELQVFEGRVVKVSAGEEGPGRGSLCGKGFFGFQYLNGPDRLATPLVRTDGYVRGAELGEALDFLAERLRGVPGEAMGAIVGGRLTVEEAFSVRRFMEVLGSKHVATTASFSVSPFREALREICGRDHIPKDLGEVARADCVLVVGDLEAENQVAANLVREALFKGSARLVLAHPRRPLLAEEADCLLQFRPGDEVFWIAGFLRGLAEARGQGELVTALETATPEYVEQRTGIPAGLIEEAVGHLKEASRPAVVVSSLYGMSPRGGEVMKGLLSLALLAGALSGEGCGLHLLGPQANMVGVADMLEGGPSPLDVLRGVVQGEVKALFLWGEDPFLSCPKGLVERALERAELVVVWDTFLGPTAQRAHGVIPAVGHAERGGHFVNASGRVQEVAAVLEPPPKALTVEALAQGLASRLGKEFKMEDPWVEICSQFPLYKGEHRWAEGEVEGTPKAMALPQDGSKEGFPYRLMVEGLFFNHHVGSAQEVRDGGFAQVVPEAHLAVNPADAEAEGLGEEARVITPYGEARIKVRPTTEVPRGGLSLVVGLDPTLGTALVGEEGEVPPYGFVEARLERV